MQTESRKLTKNVRDEKTKGRAREKTILGKHHSVQRAAPVMFIAKTTSKWGLIKDRNQRK